MVGLSACLRISEDLGPCGHRCRCALSDCNLVESFVFLWICVWTGWTGTHCNSTNLLSHSQAGLQQQYLLLDFIPHLVSPHSWLQMAVTVGKLLLRFWVRQTNDCEGSTFGGVGSVAWQEIWHHRFWFYTTVWIGVNIREGLSWICVLSGSAPAEPHFHINLSERAIVSVRHSVLDYWSPRSAAMSSINLWSWRKSIDFINENHTAYCIPQQRVIQVLYMGPDIVTFTKKAVSISSLYWIILILYDHSWISMLPCLLTNGWYSEVSPFLSHFLT